MKNLKSTLSVLLLIICSVAISKAFALSDLTPTPEPSKADEPHFLCTVRLITGDIEDGYGEREFKVNPVAGGGHGGQAQIFDFGDHTIHAISDWRWLGLAWFKGEKKLAHTVNVVTGANDHRVLIVFHPDSDEEQVSIDCSVVL